LFGAGFPPALASLGSDLKRSLQASEWILSFSLLLLLASLFLIARFHEHRKRSQLARSASLFAQQVEVEISGEVARPGVFRATAGSRLGDLVKKSRPKRFADLRHLNLDEPVSSNLQIRLESLAEIVVRIEGAAEPIELRLPAGSRICDLKSKIRCAPEADPKFFKKRRLLKDGETVAIPKCSLPRETLPDEPAAVQSQIKRKIRKA